MTQPETSLAGGSWRELLGRKYVGASAVLAGGVLLYATNEFLTISLLPSAVEEIGGQRYYAWVMTVYLVASVAGATTVSALLARFGPRLAYLGGLAVFAGGSTVCALAPSMEMLLVGRVVQGAAGGLLAGLGYAVINAALPQSLWTRASALVSAMWGVGTFLGPAGGGLFAQFGSWRWAFGALVALTIAIAVLVPIALPRRSRGHEVVAIRVPVWSLLPLGTAALLVSVAGVPENSVYTAALLVAGGVLVAVFLVVDRRTKDSVLPPTAFRPGPLKWIYLTLGVLMAATMVVMYVPLFGQRLAQLAPATAGALGVTLAIGWTVSEIVSASADRRALVARIVFAAPLVMAVGLAASALLVRDGMDAWLVLVWGLALLIAGVGIGMAWPHLSAWAMTRVDDPAEGPVAAAAINTVQLICGAFGAGLAGVVVNAAGSGDAGAARWVFGVFAVIAAVGCVASYGASRERRITVS
ncbi:MFS transporter [[Mycobacterium] burgundiense]|uniref:MFS transporter n=1 Tax=[Mycobacterium] burgundiense TaxID=3064286 RepID=A0ABM9LPB7_9MYCO|nr:MFS transporter [Mycolicibacterium sp. MU0053]CAJ1502445.1 MFS transporter [Mycolicibacterium sp. MU0053]